MARIGLITYAEPEPFHVAQMDMVERALLLRGRQAEFLRCFGARDEAKLAAEAERLAAWKPDLVVSLMTNANRAVEQATAAAQTPIVCWSMDPVDAGLVHSMRRPGGRLTGVAFPPGLQSMQLRAVKKLKPQAGRVAMLCNFGYAIAEGALHKLVAAGALFNLEVVPYEATSLQAARSAVSRIARDRCDALIVGPHELFNRNGGTIGRHALECGLPALGLDSVVESGGVIGFTPDFAHIWDAAAVIALRVLEGEGPASIPFDRHIMPLVTLNLDSAHRLGLNLDPAFVDEADRLIGVSGK